MSMNIAVFLCVTPCTDVSEDAASSIISFCFSVVCFSSLLLSVKYNRHFKIKKRHVPSSYVIDTNPGAHPAYYTVGTGPLSRG